MKRFLILAVAATLLTPAAHADEVTDTLQSAMDAYNEGDVKYALEELAFAQQLLQAMKAEGLTAFLPEAPEGWTREVNTDLNQGLAMMGGGTGAEAEYSDGSQSITITLMADNPMVGAMAGMFGNPMLMANSGKIIRVGREKFLDQSGEVTGLVNGRVLVKGEGDDTDAVIALLEKIDFKALGNFGL